MYPATRTAPIKLHTLPTAEILSGKNVQAFLVCGFLMNLRSKKLRKEVKENTISFWAQPTSKLEFHSTEEQKIKEETMEESSCLCKNVTAPIPKLDLRFVC